jgi:hypothetical protein
MFFKGRGEAGGSSEDAQIRSKRQEKLEKRGQRVKYGK